MYCTPVKTYWREKVHTAEKAQMLYWHLTHFSYPIIDVLWVHQITNQFIWSLKAVYWGILTTKLHKLSAKTPLNGWIEHKVLEASLCVGQWQQGRNLSLQKGRLRGGLATSKMLFSPNGYPQKAEIRDLMSEKNWKGEEDGRSEPVQMMISGSFPFQFVPIQKFNSRTGQDLPFSKHKGCALGDG